MSSLGNVPDLAAILRQHPVVFSQMVDLVNCSDTTPASSAASRRRPHLGGAEGSHRGRESGKDVVEEDQHGVKKRRRE
jgi:hypothetical protein